MGGPLSCSQMPQAALDIGLMKVQISQFQLTGSGFYSCNSAVTSFCWIYSLPMCGTSFSFIWRQRTFFTDILGEILHLGMESQLRQLFRLDNIVLNFYYRDYFFTLFWKHFIHIVHFIRFLKIIFVFTQKSIHKIVFGLLFFFNYWFSNFWSLISKCPP